MAYQKGFLSIVVLALIGGTIVIAGAGIYFFSEDRTENLLAPVPQPDAIQESRRNMYTQELLDIESELLVALKAGGITQEGYEKMGNELRRLAADGADAGKVEILQSMLVKLNVGRTAKPAASPSIMTREEVVGMDSPLHLQEIPLVKK